ncbi:MAG: lipid II flippase MurJ, partial [Phycisphaerae bacterium]|nr:lipid II flippase MurJ [Phycisphaerae bacterium]
LLSAAMRRKGLALRPVWEPKNPGLKRVKGLILPAILAVGIVQVNSGLDRIIALLLSPGDAAMSSFAIFGREVQYPMSLGAPAVLYFGARLYMFPLGVFGIALATAVFPLFSRLAVRGDTAGFSKAVSHGVRLALFIGIPSSVGLILVCEPFIAVWLRYGRVVTDAAEAQTVARISWVVLYYSVGVWAYCVVHILTRAFYAMENIRTPRRVAMYAAGANLVLNLILVWFLREGGLALATARCAIVQVPVLWYLLGGRVGGLRVGEVLSSAARTCVASLAMGVACLFGMTRLAPIMVESGGAGLSAAQVAIGLAAGLIAFVLAAAALRMPELKEIFSLRRPEKETSTG